MVRNVDITLGDISTEYAAPRHRDLALRANYESCSILETVVGKIVDDGPLNTSSADHFLQLLKEWSQALPVSLRTRPRRGDLTQFQDPNNREKMVANVHVAGTYYFGIILITRSFLIQHVMPQLGGGGSKPKEKARRGDEASNDAASVAEYSSSCNGAAVFLAQMCRDAVDAGVFMGNMCIIKAWVFAAGLVLGFALLAPESCNADTREAFRSSQHVLSILGRLSAQAEQYHKILAAFSDAIDKYTRQMMRQQASRVPHVEQILSYDASSGVSAGIMGGGVFAHMSYDTPRNEFIVNMEATQEEGQPVLSANVAQIPTPDLNIDEAAAADHDFWNGSDSLSSITMSDFVPENWPTAADNELMLRILWDGYAMSFDEPLPQVNAPRDLGVHHPAT